MTDETRRSPGWHATTILMVRKGGKVVIGGDGQVSMGQTVVKSNARKVRRLVKGDVIAGFAGATADAFTLFERLEAKLEQYPGQLARACVELAKDWRTDRYLRRLEAMLIVADKTTAFTLSGSGDVLEPEERRVRLGDGDRLGRQLCARRRPGAHADAARGGRDRAPLDAHRRRDLRLHQLQSDCRKPLNLMSDLSPREIVSELDRYIVGQGDAKRAVAIALRNRWRRLRLASPMREEVMPKNILMIGPTGCGKTEIARRLAKLAGAPFLKVEATKFTEVGYVGRDVEQIVRDLVEVAIALVKSRKRKDIEAKAELEAEERVLDALVGSTSSPATRETFRRKLRAGELSDKEIELELPQSGGGMPMFELPNMPGASIGAINIADIFGKSQRTKAKRMTVAEAHEPLVAAEADKLLDQDAIVRDALAEVESNGIVFLDEIDKICARENRSGADVSREGVQRDLLPLIEGTTVATKHGAVKTDHILFVASGAFHIAKPSDLLPELQGRLPIRVELNSLTEDDFRRILTDTEASLIKQYVALMQTEGLELEFTDDAVAAIARLAAKVNGSVENIGARRLQTVMERVLDEVSFTAADRSGDKVRIDADFVERHIGDLAANADLSRFIL